VLATLPTANVPLDFSPDKSPPGGDVSAKLRDNGVRASEKVLLARRFSPAPDGRSELTQQQQALAESVAYSADLSITSVGAFNASLGKRFALTINYELRQKRAVSEGTTFRSGFNASPDGTLLNGFLIKELPVSAPVARRPET